MRERRRERGGVSSWYVSVDTYRPDEQSAKRLLDGEGETSVPEEQATSEAQLRKLEQLATERLLAVGGSGMATRRSVLSNATSVEVR